MYSQMSHLPIPCAEDGRGILLVARLSARWGYRRGDGELTTWFQIPRNQGNHASVRTNAFDYSERERLTAAPFR
jgi:hypothetical protein